jgi:lysophospholipase L1-like esterase
MTSIATIARRRVTTLLVSLAAMALVAGNVIGFSMSRHYYQREQDVRLDPLGLRWYAAVRAAASASAGARGTRPVLAMFGDSRIQMWTMPSGLEEWEVVNLGIGDQSSPQALLRFDFDVPPLRPTVVLFELGINDLKDIPIFPERRDAIVAECKANLARLTEKSRALGAIVVIATIFDLGDVALYRRPFWSAPPVAIAVDEVNAFIRTLARDGVVVFETGRALDAEPGKVRPSYQLDHLHLAPSGYAALNEELVPLVRTLPIARR